MTEKVDHRQRWKPTEIQRAEIIQMAGLTSVEGIASMFRVTVQTLRRHLGREIAEEATRKRQALEGKLQDMAAGEGLDLSKRSGRSAQRQAANFLKTYRRSGGTS